MRPATEYQDDDGKDESYRPAQRHSDTSVEAADKLDRKRTINQERWVYETLRTQEPYADWQLWEMCPKDLFDLFSSLHRARIGLMWIDKVSGATPWHPLEDSGRRVVNPDSNKSTVIWWIKEEYLDMPYEQWAKEYRALARGKASHETTS